MNKIPKETQTFKNEATLNTFRNKAHYLLPDPNLSLPRNTNIRQQKQNPSFLTTLVLHAKFFEVLKEISVT